MATRKNANGTSASDILTYSKTGTYKAGKGNDTITVKSTGKVIAYGESGNDRFTVTGGISKIYAGTGDDTVKITGGSGHVIYGQSGKDNIVISKAKKVTVDGGADNDIITVTGISSNYASKVSTGSIKGGAGSDTITIKNAGFYKVYGGDGNDKINISGGSNLVYGGSGKDTIKVNSSKANYVNAGSGDDKIYLNGYNYNNKIVGGSGNDTIYVNNTNLNLIEGGIGNDTIIVSSVWAETIIDNSTCGSSDKDKVVIKGSSSSIDWLLYDSSRDILAANYIGIKGFTKLSSVQIDGVNYTPKQILKEFSYFIDRVSLADYDRELKAYNNDVNSIIKNGITTNALAQGIGYSKK